MKMKVAISLLASAALIGCASPPNTPGAGVGASYTPVIDMQGVDPNRYANDLDACRQYSKSVDADKAAISGAIGGMVLGAAISGMLGGNRQTTVQSANYGGFTGMGAASGRALGKQERVIINCMAGRGYRALDAAFVMPMPPAAAPTASPAPQAAAQPPAASTPELLTAIPATRSIIVVPAPAAAPPKPMGQESWQVEKMPAVKACHPQPRADLSAKGPGFESYTVACASGDQLMVRCEFGNCRVLK